MKFSLKNLCAPASIYFWLTLISITISVFTHFNLSMIIVNTFFLFLWTYFLNYMCSIGYSAVSWVLVLLPIIAFAVISLKLAKQVQM